MPGATRSNKCDEQVILDIAREGKRWPSIHSSIIVWKECLWDKSYAVPISVLPSHQTQPTEIVSSMSQIAKHWSRACYEHMRTCPSRGSAAKDGWRAWDQRHQKRNKKTLSDKSPRNTNFPIFSVLLTSLMNIAFETVDSSFTTKSWASLLACCGASWFFVECDFCQGASSCAQHPVQQQSHLEYWSACWKMP